MKNKKVITIILITMFFIMSFPTAISTGQIVYGSSENQVIKNFNIYPEMTPLLSPRYILGENDEGLHQNRLFKMQEWWYFNVYFNDEKSELKNWSIVISFLIYPYISSHKLGLYDDENNSYGGSNVRSKDALEYKGPGFNVQFDNSSFAIGRYPNWKIYAEHTKSNSSKIYVNLTFKANSLPMWILKNTGHNRSKSLFGYYCIMNCSVIGNVSLNGTIYNVSGLGYHDHTWTPFSLKIPIFNVGINKAIDVLSSWDWLCIHFENGWDMFIGKIYDEKRNLFSKFTPGSLCFTESGTKLYECYFFILEYDQTINSTIPNLKIPTKIHIKAIIFNTLGLKQFKEPILLDFYYEAKNIQEFLSGDPPNGWMWQSQGKTYGVAKGPGKTVQLNGWAIIETTSNL